MELQPDTSIQTVTFSIFGESFTLRCRKDQIEQLQNSIRSIQDKTSRMLRDNPTLTPQQAAILIAIETENALQGYMHTNTPFQDEAFEILKKVRDLLGKNAV